MLDLTRKLDTLEKKLDSGFDRIEQKLDDFEKRLVGKFDRLEITMNSFEQHFASNVASLRRTIDSGFIRCSQQGGLTESVARLEFEVARLKAHAGL